MTNEDLDALVTRLYRAAVSIKDAGWQGLLKNAAFSLSAAQGPSALIAAVALTDTVLLLAEHARQLDEGLTWSLRDGLRAAIDRPSVPAQLSAPRSSLEANTR